LVLPTVLHNISEKGLEPTQLWVLHSVNLPHYHKDLDKMILDKRASLLFLNMNNSGKKVFITFGLVCMFWVFSQSVC
jgi:hypothetical protein